MTTVDRLNGVNSGLGIKAPVRAATTANITLSGEQTIDAIACVEDDRVLVKDQSTASENGIYVVSSGNWTRATDFDGNRDIVSGTIVLVNSGTTNGSSLFKVTSSNPITIGTSNISFAEVTLATDLDATLDALAALDSTAGLVEQTGEDTFTKRAIGVGASTSIPTRADADARYQGLDATLTALAAVSATSGFLALTAGDTFAARTLTAPAAGLTITNPAGVAGDPTFALANDLAALEALSGTDTIYYRSGADTWSAVVVDTGLSFSSGTLSVDGVPVSSGGTGLSTFDQGDVLYASAANTLAGLTKDTNATRYLANTGTNNGPAWDQVELTNGVSGELPVANGGTGSATASDARTALGLAIGSDVQAYHARLADIAGATYAQGNILYHNGSNLVVLAPGTDGQLLQTKGAGANPQWVTAAGTGDLLSTNNLSDVDDADTARANLAIPARNHIHNGAMQVSQRGALFTSSGSANNDDSYTLDRWILLSDGNDVVDVRQDTVAPTNGLNSLSLDVETANLKFGVMQILEQKDCIGLIGNEVTLSFYCRRAGTGLDNVKAAIIAWDGTADTVTSDIVSAWNVEGTDPTLVANWTYENTPANLNISTSWARYSVTATVDTASAKNIGVFIWSDVTGTTVGSADLLYITDVQLEIGGVASPFERRPVAIETAICQRHYYRRTSTSTADYMCMGQCYNTTSAFGSYPLPTTMRVDPAVAVSAASHISVTNATSSAVAMTGVTFTDSTKDNIIFATITGGSGLVAGNATFINLDTVGGWVEASADL